MAMHRFYVPLLPDTPKTIALTDNEAAHAAKVLRIQPGEEVVLLNGRGTRAWARVSQVSRRHVDLEVTHLEESVRPTIEITLFQSVIKPSCMDWLVEKATELGVHCIQPILTEHVVSRLDAAEADRKAEKWRRTAVESMKQCGGPWLPIIQAPMPFAQAIESSVAFDCQIVASLAHPNNNLRQALKTMQIQRKTAEPLQGSLWIGPEGDFSPDETRHLLAAQVVPISLGQNTLRSETAAICALSLMRYELELELPGNQKPE